jgi:hypothetical protein
LAAVPAAFVSSLLQTVPQLLDRLLLDLSVAHLALDGRQGPHARLLGFKASLHKGHRVCKQGVEAENLAVLAPNVLFEEFQAFEQLVAFRVAATSFAFGLYGALLGHKGVKGLCGGGGGGREGRGTVREIMQR